MLYCVFFWFYVFVVVVEINKKAHKTKWNKLGEIRNTLFYVSQRKFAKIFRVTVFIFHSDLNFIPAFGH